VSRKAIKPADDPKAAVAAPKTPKTVPPPSSLDNLSIDELKRHQVEIERRIREKQLAEKKAMIAQIVDIVTTYEIPVEELVDALGGLKVRRKSVIVEQKYRDPDSGATWSGRGKEPAWIKDKDRDAFLIK
jgi:DNA-binding protein H-NS